MQSVVFFTNNALLTNHRQKAPMALTMRHPARMSLTATAGTMVLQGQVGRSVAGLHTTMTTLLIVATHVMGLLKMPTSAHKGEIV